MTDDRVQLTQYEIQFDIRDLKIHFRTMEIRFRLNNKNTAFAYSRGQLFLKCNADIESIPNVKRQTSEFVYIRSDEKTNLRLINSARLSEYNCLLECISLIAISQKALKRTPLNTLMLLI